MRPLQGSMYYKIVCYIGACIPSPKFVRTNKKISEKQISFKGQIRNDDCIKSRANNTVKNKKSVSLQSRIKIR